jgi:hypothetical protein
MHCNATNNPNLNTYIMNERTIVSLEINGTEIEIKSRREGGSPSGWAVIAFTPSCSIRSIRIHLDSKLAAFASAIAASVSPSYSYISDVEAIKKAILSITLDHDTVSQ